MTDMEKRLSRALHDRLDHVVADPTRAAATLRRTRRLRVLRAGTAVFTLAAFAVGAVAGAGVLRRDERGIAPSETVPAVAVFTVELAPGGSGRVAVDARGGQVCYSLDVETAIRGKLRRDEPGPKDPVVATFFETVTSYAPQLCAPVDAADAASLLEEPEVHYLELEAGMKVTRGALEPLDESPGEAPVVAEVVCGSRGAVSMTPLVRPQHAGVYIYVHNYGGPQGEFYFVAPDGGHEIGSLRRDGRERNITAFAPGPLQVGCVKGALTTFAFDGPGSERHAELEIVDPEGLWNERELRCGYGRRMATIRTDGGRSYEELIRSMVPGIEEDDEIERPGYPGGSFKLPSRTIVREGEPVATLVLPSGKNGKIIPTVCPGSGIAGEGA